MDPAARKVARSGVALELTPREIDILACLLRAEGRAVSRETLAREVWNGAVRATPLDNVIDVLGGFDAWSEAHPVESASI